MRYVVMHKASSDHEDGTPPPADLIANMGNLIGEAVKAGIFLAGEGLHPSSKRLRIVCRAGRCTVTPGPYDGASELPAAFTAIRTQTRDEAIEWATRYAQALGNANLEVGQLTEAWDLGLCAKPDGAPLRFLIIHQADATTEAGTPSAGASAGALRELLAEMTRAGVLQFTESLLPSAKATRLIYRDNRRTMIDGPFSESKELIGGFCMMQMRSLDEVVEWTDRYVKILGGNVEVDVRLAAEPTQQADGRSK